ncbi:hypothetical protein GH714_005802 [Hevea brasiliensis]|uniref:Protein kinase domain-containing protein n=1 Tax=Hevea brasiliensis TaxID=3981 RepID=A0A6A6KZD5_HEVBR|nr:hypothetical protein GH714_005802 [Hevea brasiliensis]
MKKNFPQLFFACRRNSHIGEIVEYGVKLIVLKIAYSHEKPQFPTHYSEEGLDFLAKCLERNPKMRWSADELLDNPFIYGKSQRKFTRSPASAFDVGIFDEAYDSDESESSQEDEF